VRIASIRSIDLFARSALPRAGNAADVGQPIEEMIDVVGADNQERIVFFVPIGSLAQN
jgi:hypothetical protein